MLRVLFVLFIILMGLTLSQAQELTQIDTLNLNENWSFRQGTSAVWKSAMVPGTVQEDLLRLGDIPDPFFGTNEDSLLWVEKADWVYRTHFALPESQQQKKQHTLHFHGLDTYADVYLNGHCILLADNMFRSWSVDVGPYLQAQNDLKIIFHSPIKRGKNLLDLLPYELPAGNDTGDPKVMPVVRKAAFHFGWDWGPRIVTSGVWRPIHLVSHNTRIQEFLIHDQLVDGHKAIINATLVLNGASGAEGYSYKSYVDGKRVGTGVWPIIAPEHSKALRFTIDDYEAWWPNDLGAQKLYTLKVELYKEGKLIDSRSKKIGIRKAELIHEQDSIGTSFYFKINGESVFAKGANYIPQRHMTNQVTVADYRKLLTEAAECHMNMIRVWGGGIYEEDIFYELCDSLGLMVWQDFMFANTMYNDKASFIKSIEAEVIDNVKRLAHHPSIVHWCGNNEIAVAWKNWGWQKEFNLSEKHQSRLEAQYDFLFKNKIPDLLHDILPSANYSHSSPLSNWGVPENFNHSSMHYWGVYHGEDPFEDYTKNIGRFVSEYGFQTFPSYNLMQTYFPSASFKMEDPLMAHRQKSYKGNRLIYKHISDYYPVPKSLLELSYLSQMTQATGISMAIQHHRMDRPRCMGTLYWQLNDCWPAISWSSRDYNGQWKALMYAVKEDYRPVACFLDTISNEKALVIVNDTRDVIKGTLYYVVKDNKFKSLGTYEMKINLERSSSHRIRIDIDNTMMALGTHLELSLKTQIDTLKKTILLRSDSDLSLSPARVEMGIEATAQGYILSLSSDSFVRALYLYAEGQVVHFDKNFVDLYPGQTVDIHCTSDEAFNVKAVKWISMNDIQK